MRSIKKKVMKRLQAMMMSDSTMRLMADPRFQKVLMAAFQAQHSAKSRYNQGVAALARRLNLATKSDMSKLNRRIRELESALEKSNEKVQRQ